MTTAARVAAESFTLVGILPVGWLVVRAWLGKHVDPGLWWLALAFAVSFVADNVGRVVDPAVVRFIYPVSQAALVGAVFLLRRDALLFLVTLVAAGVFSIVADHDIILRVVAWGGVCGIVADRWEQGARRTALLIYFGLGLIAWCCYLFAPGWTTYLLYQGTRTVGVLWFCWSTRVGPHLRVTS